MNEQIMKVQSVILLLGWAKFLPCWSAFFLFFTLPFSTSDWLCSLGDTFGNKSGAIHNEKR